MKNFHRHLAVWSIFSLTLTVFAQAPVPKQLAGPPSEFKTMQPNPLEMDGIRSKSALLPVHFEVSKNGLLTWKAPFSVENPDSFQMVVFSGDADWQIQLRAPGMKRSEDIESLYTEARDDWYGIEENLLPCKFYNFDSRKMGTWQIEVTSQSPGEGRTGSADGFVLVGSDNPYRLYSHATTRATLVGHPVGLAAFPFDARNVTPEATPTIDGQKILSAKMTVTTPSGSVFDLTMTDDGLNNDGIAGDGIYGRLFTPEEPGRHLVQIIAKSLGSDGTTFVRTTEHTIPVLFPELSLAPQEAFSKIEASGRLSVSIPVETFEDSPEKYRVFAEVWGKNLHGEPAPVAWIGGMVHVDGQTLKLGLDPAWIGNSGATGPFELRDLRIEDPDFFVPLVNEARLDLYVERLPDTAFLETKTISDEMRMGPRPSQPAQKAGGPRLLLVHGYCSSNVWGGVAGQFSQASVFQDFNQNRSHDAFAMQILSAGSAWDSYGIVAHSQGGAAALHLYTYYWSGLDYASSGRLIQSVGTPYQGTALAGNLAAIGAVFGAGCGTNSNLTYSGSSSWLSGIPSWARSAVNYYTTSFEDRWWAYDYCHLATDLFLDDPDDGTTEKSKGQLSGGINRGHKTGWCHTSGMRDPAQTTDSSRNATMNSNAAR